MITDESFDPPGYPPVHLFCYLLLPVLFSSDFDTVYGADFDTKFRPNSAIRFAITDIEVFGPKMQI